MHDRLPLMSIHFQSQWTMQPSLKVMEKREGVQTGLGKTPNWSGVLFMWRQWERIGCHAAVISAAWQH